MATTTVSELDSSVQSIVTLIQGGDWNAARLEFRRLIQPLYAEIITNHKHPLRCLLPYLFDLDDYLNKEECRLSEAVSREDILASFSSDYLEALSEARQREAGEPA